MRTNKDNNLKSGAFRLFSVVVGVICLQLFFAMHFPSDREHHWIKNSVDKSVGKDDPIKYGKELIEHTGKFIGPNGKVSATGNGMNCQDCHMKAGTKPFGNHLLAASSNYPRIKAKNDIQTLEERINECIDENLNGKQLDTAGTEIQAMKAYLIWLGKDIKSGSKLAGISLKEINSSKSPDSEKGKQLYKSHCKHCHGANGEGLEKSETGTFLHPPLWGDRSFTTASGFNKISRLAGFIRYNMPLGATYDAPHLSEEEAINVASFILGQRRTAMK